MTDSPSTDLLSSQEKPSELKLRLRVVSGPDQGKVLPLERGSYIVGKAPDCDLPLTDGAVSRNHLSVAVLRAAARVSDLQSTNGSFYDGMRFVTLELQPGGVVRLGRTELRLELASAPEPTLALSSRESIGRLVGRSAKMREAFALIERAASSEVSVLIEGETGTGKELCAEAIHLESPRRKGPLVPVDLASVAPTLFESELFGHVRGAFTGANADRAGAFERARGGTLFLDELGELPLDLQPRLLRALEQRQIKRVGGDDYRSVDVRVLAATNRDLEAEVRAGRFREDLYHRLAVVKLRLPPLRERPEDIPLLVERLLVSMGREPDALSTQVLALRRQYPWPGNVRELRNVVERAVTLGAEVSLPANAAPASRDAGDGEHLGFKEAKERLVDAFARDYLKGLLERCGNNLSKAAREANVDRVYLYRLLRKHRIEVKDPGAGGSSR